MTPVTPARLALLAVAAAAALGMPRCGKPSDETVIRAVIEDSVSRAGRRDVEGLMGPFAPDYRDFEGRDPAATRRLVTEYLDRYHGVVIHLLGARVGAVDPDGTAEVECEVSLSHGAAEVLRQLIRYAGEYYRFKLELRKTGPGLWRYSYAEWRTIDLTELFPESLAVLKKLFPGL